MRRPLFCALAVCFVLGCGSKKPPKPVESDPSSKGDSTAGDGTAKTDGSDDKADGGKDECVGLEISDLMESLQKSSCEVANLKTDDKPFEPKDKLVVTVSTSSLKVAPGGHVDVTVTFSNKSKDNIPLYFTIDPLPRFEIEAYDAKGGRIDMPAKPPPPLPAGVAARVPGDPKTARVTLAANGNARMHLGWDAVKMKWAPEKLKGTPPEKGYPRTANGPLPKGKYVLRIVTPLVGVFEGLDHEVSAPKTPIEVVK